MSRSLLFCAAVLLSIATRAVAQNTQYQKWAWIVGTSTVPSNQPAGKIPNGRTHYGTAFDGTNFYIYGGTATNQATPQAMNDLWTCTPYPPASAPYTCRNIAGDPGQHNPDDPTQPAARWDMGLTSAGGSTLWMFGGATCNSRTCGQQDNQLWKFDGSNWNRISGSTAALDSGQYGVINTPAATNMPSARSQHAMTVDVGAGRVWIFGGTGIFGVGTPYTTNTLWRYDINTKFWTWVQGSTTPQTLPSWGPVGQASALTDPGARIYSQIVTDSGGKLWLFGGQYLYPLGTNPIYFSDILSLDPSQTTPMWTFVAGNFSNSGYGQYSSPQYPPARIYHSFVYASGLFFIFGGAPAGITNSALNDLWMFDSGKKQFSFLSGSNAVSSSPSPGSAPAQASNTYAATYFPSGRAWPCFGRSASSGGLWVYGGVTYGNTGNGTSIGELTYTDFWSNGGHISPASRTQISTGVLLSAFALVAALLRL